MTSESAHAGPAIVPLTPSDLEGAFALSASVGWNQRAADWRMLLDLAPAGSFAAVDDGRVVGTAIGIDYERFGWIAMMIVDPQYRGRGLGAKLLESAMRAIPPELPIRLDATPLGRPLYQRYGFQDEAVLSRHAMGPSVRTSPARSDETPGAIRRLAADDLPFVMEVDTRAFAGSRRPVIDWMLEGAPQYAWINADDRGAAEYCLGRAGRTFDQIGPVVARDSTGARALVEAALRRRTGNALVIDAFETHEAFTAFLQEAGFRNQRPLYRMCRSTGHGFERRRDEHDPIEFAILGPEFA
jgi:GNAT superfamily N-acetyltransferase